MKKIILFFVILVAIASVFTSCSQKSSTSAEKKNLTFGVSPGPYSDLFKVAIKPELEKKGYSVKIVELTDWVTPNLSLANGEIDANIFQHTHTELNLSKNLNRASSSFVFAYKIPLTVLYSKHWIKP